MKVLFIVPYPVGQAPSQRFRFEQYFTFLNQNKIDIEIAPFLDDKTWDVLYKPGSLFQKFRGFSKGFIKRTFLAFRLKRYDVLFIHREACPIGPALFEYLYSKIFKGKIIFDFDDAIWRHDVSDANTYLGFLKFPEKTASIIKYANTVVAGNQYLKEYAFQFNNNTVIIPTTIDLEYHSTIKQYSQSPIIIGWTGSVTTIRHFETSYSFLKKIKLKYRDKVKILLISNYPPMKEPSLEIEFTQWSKDSEVRDLSRIDIGIMPLPDDQWTRGKCGFKGLQYMSLGIPCIMSPVGVNREIIQDGVNGFIADDDQEWIDKITRLIESEELRIQLGKAGKQTIADRYSIEARKPDYLNLFKTQC